MCALMQRTIFARKLAAVLIRLEGLDFLQPHVLEGLDHGSRESRGTVGPHHDRRIHMG